MNLNLATKTYQNHFFHPLLANVSSKTTKFLNKVIFKEEKNSGTAHRIALFASLIFGLCAACYLIKTYFQKINQVSPLSVTLKTQFLRAKQEILVSKGIGRLDQKELNLEQMKSVKIFLTIEHKDQCFTETHVISDLDLHFNHDQRAKQICDQLDDLSLKLQQVIKFHAHSRTLFKLGLLFKEKKQGDANQFFVSCVYGKATICQEKMSNLAIVNNTHFPYAKQRLQLLCEMLEIPVKDQFDGQGNLI